MTKHLPNILTLLRLVLAAPIAYFLLNNMVLLGVVCYAIAAFTDLFDGLLARRFGTSKIGSFLDPIADKILVLTAFICLWYLQKISLGIIVIVLLRDLVIVSGALWHFLLLGPYQLRPTLLGKWNTAMQLIYLSACMLALLFTVAWLDTLVMWLAFIVIGLAIVSAIDYIIKARQQQWLTPGAKRN